MMTRKLQRFLLVTTSLFFLLQVASAQTATIAKADAFFFSKDWSSAKTTYEAALKDTSVNAIAWNRLGFSNYNLKLYDAALKNYQISLSLNPPPGLKPIVYSRIAKIHALKNDKQDAYKIGRAHV